MLRTKFTDLTGCKVPIQQAAIGGLARPQLATAVSEAGGLGMVYAGSFDSDQMTEVFEDMRRRTSGVFGANFLIPEAFVSDLKEIHEQVETASKLVKVVEFFYRQPDASLVDLVHQGGALASWQVGSNEEAVAAAEAGCDIIVAQGVEAGGHVRGKVSLLTLLSQVLDSVKVPVLATGGIGSGRALAAVLAAGASGARVGTRFIAATEAGAHPECQSIDRERARVHRCYRGLLRRLAQRTSQGTSLLHRGSSEFQRRHRGTQETHLNRRNGPRETPGVFHHDQRDYRNHQGHAALGGRISERSEDRQTRSSNHQRTSGGSGDTPPQMTIEWVMRIRVESQCGLELIPSGPDLLLLTLLLFVII